MSATAADDERSLVLPALLRLILQGTTYIQLPPQLLAPLTPEVSNLFRLLIVMLFGQITPKSTSTTVRLWVVIRVVI